MDNSLPSTAPNAGRGTHPLVIIAAIAVTLFCMAGIAAIMGWIPSSKGQQEPAAATAPLTEAAPAPVTTPAKVAEAPQPPKTSATKPVAKPVTKPATHAVAKASESPVQVAAVTPPPPPPPATVAQPPKAPCYDCGTIESVRVVQKKGEGSGLGAAAGGVLGGVLGHQVGNGRGRDVMTVVGAVGGAVAGHQVEKNVKTTTVYDVTVRFEDGTARTLQQATEPVWRPGDRVRVINSEIVPNS